MSRSPSPLFTDTIRAIPAFFGFRLGAEPAYHMEDIVGDVEIRRYAPALLAHVFVEGSHETAVAAAHAKLADYIYGNNECREKMEMTSPAFQADGDSKMFPHPRKHDDPDGWTVAFFLSNSLTTDEAPHPDDPAISILETSEILIATLRYRGYDTEKLRSLAKEDLIAALSGSRWEVKDHVYWASYDQTFAIPYFRRNEVHAPVRAHVPRPGSARQSRAKAS